MACAHNHVRVRDPAAGPPDHPPYRTAEWAVYRVFIEECRLPRRSGRSVRPRPESARRECPRRRRTPGRRS